MSQNLRVLIADDDEYSRLILSETLTKLGHQVVACSNGLDALKILQAPDAPPLAILDWMMPGMTGLEICKDFNSKAVMKKPYFILLTIRNGKHDILEGFRAGINDFLTKPLNLSDLTARLEVAINAINLQSKIELQQLNMLSASKMATLGQMAGGLAHEINNPLGIICGNASILTSLAQETPIDRDKIDKICDTMTRASFRIAKIIEGLRVFAGTGEQEDFKRVPISNILEDTLSLCLTRFTNHKVELKVDMADPKLSLECRPAQISQVLLNLLTNSLLAVEKQEKERWIKVEVSGASGPHLEIAVIDSGEGIPKNVRDRIMQPFFTTRELGQGTGLGLSICKGILESHGGKLCLDENSKRTRFVIQLPWTQAQTEASKIVA